LLRPAGRRCDGRGEWFIDEPFLYTVNGAKYYVHQNHLFSVSAVTDAAGSTRERYSYTGYGDRAIRTPAGAPLAKSLVNNGIGFTGYVLNNETEQYHARARQFDAAIGQFISRDPLGYEDSFGLYEAVFVPLYNDPDGTFSIIWDEEGRLGPKFSAEEDLDPKIPERLKELYSGKCWSWAGGMAKLISVDYDYSAYGFSSLGLWFAKRQKEYQDAENEITNAAKRLNESLKKFTLGIKLTSNYSGACPSGKKCCNSSKSHSSFRVVDTGTVHGRLSEFSKAKGGKDIPKYLGGWSVTDLSSTKTKDTNFSVTFFMVWEVEGDLEVGDCQ
jgi:RHS repeat-associated protein